MGKKYLGRVSDPKDIVTKEYVDGSTGEIKTIISNRGPLPTDAGTPGQRWLDTAHGNVEYTCIAVTEGTPNTYTWIYTGGSNYNLLVNGWFSINQIGKTSYSTTGEYTVDMWLLTSGAISVTSNGISRSSGTVTLRTGMESEVKTSLVGKKVTFSAKFSDGTIKSVTTTMTANTRFRVNLSGTVSVLDSLDSGYNLEIAQVYGTGSKIVRAVKLEVGSVSTLGMDSMPNTEDEKQRCLPYMRVLYGSIPAFSVGFLTQIDGTASSQRAFLYVPLSSPMRITNPSLKLIGEIGELQLYATESDYAIVSQLVYAVAYSGGAIVAVDIKSEKPGGSIYNCRRTNVSCDIVLDCNLL